MSAAYGNMVWPEIPAPPMSKATAWSLLRTTSRSIKAFQRRPDPGWRVVGEAG